jgi:transposase
MAYLQGVPREQGLLLPRAVEDYVSADNPVRVVDAFVEGLDLPALGFPAPPPCRQGAPGYDPRTLLKLYLYGYLHRIRSSRELEKATRRNLEVLWLLRTLTPDHWTINEFRRQHRERFRGVFRQFHLLCADLQLFGQELVAIDGTYLKAVNNPARNFSKAKLEAAVQEMDERTERYLETLEKTDREAATAGLEKAGAGTSAQASADALRAKLAQLAKRRAEYAEMLSTLTAEPGKQISLTDPDSRSLQKGAERVVGYNAQIAVDAAHHLIVAEAVTCAPNDTQLLAPMAQAAQEALGVEGLAAVSDKGYFNIQHLELCAQAGIETYVPGPRVARPAGDGSYPDQAFHYVAEADHFRCPQGQCLPRRGETQRSSGTYRLYFAPAACRACPVRPQCTRGAYRRLSVHEHHETVQAAQARLQKKPELLRRRMGLVEHVFGTLKFWLGYRSFLCRGKAMVSAEFTLACLSYNLRRVLNLVSVPELLAKLQARAGRPTMATAAA